MQVVVNGLLTNYEIEGSGPATILLLHGWGDNSAGLKGLRGELAKNWRVVTPDLPGFGASEAPKKVWGLDDYAEFCANLLDKLNIETTAVIGHSNGGAIAIRGLASNKLKASKLVLLASAGIRGESKNRNLALRYAAKTGKQVSKVLPKSAQKSLRRKVYQTIGSDMLVAEHMQESFKKVISDDVRAGAAKITIPSLLIYGENDEQAPPRYGRIFHELMPHSELELIPEAGHFVHLDASADVTNSIADFLK